MNTVPGRLLTDERWLAERIAEMGASWGTDSARVGGTLWWCMAASALVEGIVAARVRGMSGPVPTLDGITCAMRRDGGVEQIRITDAETARPSPTGADPGAAALATVLTAVIARVSAVTGVRPPALWAVTADAIANRAIDTGAPEVGARLVAELGDPLPTPRYVEIGGRTFVRRASCCLVYEVPDCSKCISCPKRPAREREALLAEYAAQN
ncbi:(2Fe-2S)-binding protein [Nocardia paucivorans]|uniref:(2Fe-2S)-binding protein n=1 Tax=Nocardia paucivorans TaxID=114259 RepID=UPI000685EDA8|nr:(2Fe-2S)-binding protein [Nocardia paucivorans]